MGKHCPFAHNKQEGVVKLLPATNCVGDWTTDTTPLLGWKESRTYKITTPQEGNGEPCPFVHDHQEGVVKLSPPEPVDDKLTCSLKFDTKVGDPVAGGFSLSDCGIFSLVDTEGNDVSNKDQC